LYSLAIEGRTQIGVNADSTDHHNGLAIRLMADGAWTPIVGWRIEGAYTQADYNRRSDTIRVPINEFGVELGGSMRAVQRLSTKWRPYEVGGLLMSLRGSCNVSNSFDQTSTISCGDGRTIRFGWNAGAGVRYRGGLAGWDWFFETRLLNNLTSNGGGKSLAFAFGAGF
jgi:hypothetical protein